MQSPTELYDIIKEKLGNMLEKIVTAMIVDGEPNMVDQITKEIPNAKKKLKEMDIPVLLVVVNFIGKYNIPEPVQGVFIEKVADMYVQMFKDLKENTTLLLDSYSTLKNLETHLNSTGLLNFSPDRREEDIRQESIIEFVKNSNAIEKMCETIHKPEVRDALREKIENCRLIYNEYHTFFKELFHIRDTVEIKMDDALDFLKYVK